MTEIFVTKYALKRGIIRANVDDRAIQGENCIVTGGYPWDLVVLKLGEWHRTREKAVDRAKKMAVAEANKLERRSAELRAMDFEIDTTLGV